MPSVSSPARRRRRRRAVELFRVSCEECGSSFAISRRTYREHCERAKPFRCSSCLNLGGALAEMTPKERTRYRNWWLRRMSPAELDALLGWIFGPAAVTPPARERRSLLLASAQPPRSRDRAA